MRICRCVSSVRCGMNVFRVLNLSLAVILSPVWICTASAEPLSSADKTSVDQPSAAVPLSPPSRPNILIVFADDWGRHAQCYAEADRMVSADGSVSAGGSEPAGGSGTVNDILKTPHFDRVARRGVLFRNAFVSAPSCTPCRSALLTGQHFWRTGRASILRGAVWEDHLPSFPLLLQKSGLAIGESGKVWSPGIPGDAPFGAGKYAFERHGLKFSQFSEEVTRMLQEGHPLEAAKQTLFDEVRANFQDFLATRTPDQPFCYWFGPTNVHRQWVRGSGQKLWDLNPDTLSGKLPPFLADVPEVREDLADYFGEIQALDGALGVLIQQLEESGELERTMIIVSGDHGAPGFPKGKCNLYDFGTQVPLAVCGASVTGDSAGGLRIVDDLVSLTDLAPTILELCGLQVPGEMTGRSLLPILSSEKSGQIQSDRHVVYYGRERHVDSARAGCLPYPQRAIRTHEFLYIVNFKPDRWPLGDPIGLGIDEFAGTSPPTLDQLTRDTRITLADDDAGPAKAWLVSHRSDPQWKWLFEHTYGRRPREELYDLRTDPHQMYNVASDSAFQKIRGDLEAQLMLELQTSGDPRLISDGQFFETPPMAGPAGPEHQPRGRK